MASPFPDLPGVQRRGSPPLPSQLVATLAQRLRRLIAAAPVPLPGGGATPQRFRLLANWAGTDLSLARLAEGHVDAVAVIAEAGLAPPPPSTTYGVWAARSHPNATVVTPVGSGWRLSGVKEFCSGAAMLQRALVTAEAPDGYRLFDVELSSPGISVDDSSWRAVGMAGSASATVCFDGVELAEADAVGRPGFYVGRPGFWFGGVGVAACWFGGARALVTQLLASLPAAASDHVLAEVGQALAAVHTMDAVIEQAGRVIDGDPMDETHYARRLALTTREAVHRQCVAVLELTARAGGARPLGHDGDQARRAADLYVYLSQHHGASDAAELGRLALGGRAC